jgi:hypothetical protein
MTTALPTALMTELRDQFDSPWKEILEVYFEDFILFFFPQIHAEIDWSRGYDFLDQELAQVVRDAELGKRRFYSEVPSE